MTIPDVTGEVTVRMASWNALYQIRDFSSHVQQVEAFADSHKLFVEKTDKQTWRIKGTGTINISYATYWDEVGPFASQLNSEHAFINPAMILLYVPERRGEAVSLRCRTSPRDGRQPARQFNIWTGRAVFGVWVARRRITMLSSMRPSKLGSSRCSVVRN